MQAREVLARKPGSPSSKEPNLGLRNPTVTIPPTALYSVATVARTGARGAFAATVSPHETWGSTWATKKTSFIAAERPAQYGLTLYMLVLLCKGLIIGAGGLNPMGTTPSTGGVTVATGVIAGRRG